MRCHLQDISTGQLLACDVSRADYMIMEMARLGKLGFVYALAAIDESIEAGHSKTLHASAKAGVDFGSENVWWREEYCLDSTLR